MSFSLETMRMRFPHLFEHIFFLLHPKDLAKCREVNRFFEENLEKLWWMRKIQFQLEHIQCQLKNSYPEYNNDWRLVVKKISLDSLKKLHGYLLRFLFKIDHMDMFVQYLSPILVLAAFGDENLFKEISGILKNVYPKPIVCLLYIAARYDNLDTFKAIVEGSDEKNPLSKHSGCQLLHGAALAAMAAASGRFKIFQYLIQTFEESCMDNTEWSPLHFAALNGQFEICKFIIENVSNKCTTDGNDKIPLHLAAENGCLEICMLLWEQCKEKNVPDIFGRTPLHYAAKHGHLDVYNFILANADEKKPLDNEGHTPIALAKSSKCPCHDRKFVERRKCKKAA
jgi:hypothetical protein